MIVLAGGKAGTDLLARQFGMPHRCPIPLAGRPLVAHVLQTAASHPAVGSLAVSVEREAFDGLFDVLSQLPGRGIVKLVEAQPNLVDSVLAAAAGWDGPLLITTADHAMLSGGAIDAMMHALETADAAIAMAPGDMVEAANPGWALPYHQFADASYASCNLYAAAGIDALRAAEVFRGGGRFAGNAWAAFKAFGLIDLALLRLRRVTLAEAMQRLSRRFALRIAPVVLDDGQQAIDVDDLRTHGVVEGLLNRRPVKEVPAPATILPWRASA